MENRASAAVERGEGDRPPRLLTVEDVRAELNIGRTLVYRLVERGALPVVRVGRALRVRPADFEAYLEANLCPSPRRRQRALPEDNA